VGSPALPNNHPDSSVAPRVAVVGPGAIGATFASVALLAGVADLRLYGRTALPRITVNRDGSDAPVTLDSGVSDDPSTVTEPADWVLLAVKTHQVADAAAWLDALCGRDTVVVALQNGVEHRELVGPHAGPAEVLPAIVWCPAEALDRQNIRLRATPSLIVPDEPAGHRLADLLRPGGATVSPTAEFTTELWRKLATNAVAGLMVLAGRRAGIYRRTDLHELAVSLAAECVAVGNAEGAALDPATAVEVVDKLAAMPVDMGTSILFDRLADRELEWRTRNEVISRRGRRHGIPTPVSDVIVPLLAAASGSI
jgi:2-dehydropantoate 2-reductase